MRANIIQLLLFVFITGGNIGADDSNKYIYTLKNWGLNNNISKSHINVSQAWKIEKGSPSIVVAVIDTGIDADHEDLAPNLWHDPLNSSQYGWDFVSDTPNPYDSNGHGSHVAGIIGAIMDPLNGVSGVAQKVSIMTVKYYSESNPGSVNLKNTIKAIDYAIDHGARIINYSGGGPDFSEDEYVAIQRARSKNVLFVAAAGNEHQDIDLPKNYFYPASYKLDNIISVTGTDISNNLIPMANWGKTRVDVAAPGENIFSTLPGDRFGYMSGTSQATAFVTGLAALLLSKNPKLTPLQLKQIIVCSVDRLPQLKDLVASGGRINTYSALLMLKKKHVAKCSQSCQYR